VWGLLSTDLPMTLHELNKCLHLFIYLGLFINEIICFRSRFDSSPYHVMFWHTFLCPCFWVWTSFVKDPLKIIKIKKRWDSLFYRNGYIHEHNINTDKIMKFIFT
jgi:hypothetical protein